MDWLEHHPGVLDNREDLQNLIENLQVEGVDEQYARLFVNLFNDLENGESIEDTEFSVRKNEFKETYDTRDNSDDRIYKKKETLLGSNDTDAEGEESIENLTTDSTFDEELITEIVSDYEFGFEC